VFSSKNRLAQGQLRRQVRLGTEATYRVLEWNAETVEVEAVDVPGLRPGSRLTLTRAAVEAMEIVPPAGGRVALDTQRPAPIPSALLGW
jgi:hypothetical protein